MTHEKEKTFIRKTCGCIEKIGGGKRTSRTASQFGLDLMLHASDLLNLKVSDVLNESGSVKKEVRVRMKKTKKTTLNLPLSKNSIAVIKKYLIERKREDFIFRSTHYHYTKKPLSIYQYSRIVKNWLRDLGVEDVSEYSTHSIRKTKSSVFYDRTKNVDAVRRLLGQSSVTATSAYLGISDESALELARTINI